ncbi:hypothetical protein [Brevibacillus laterosporus]|uniref:hypothetical protein n=1 Tax=Brevibacillus laterosporus TaxID=1465 RepID=UPI000CE313AB|nr:hypothetical protein [Brevibacillus laterosporus]MED1665159.1 hypothetical protein [Brevibacillus laterosporus]MED1718094.1 hypothetical protein [Brevibacillus laterosporus]PPA88089.1 hypothetical protein C4A76_09980 [Brevibacillus laterosporus]
MGQNRSNSIEKPIYFMMDDDVTRGQHQINPLGRPYPSVIQPNHIETVIASIHKNNTKELWKYSRYFDNEQFWSSPGGRKISLLNQWKNPHTCHDHDHHNASAMLPYVKPSRSLTNMSCIT